MRKIIILLLIFFFIPQLSWAAADFPRLVNIHFSWAVYDDEVEELAKWDMLILDIENSVYTPENVRAIKKINPDIKIFAYISSADIRPDASYALDDGILRKQIGQRIEASDWILKNAKGNDVKWWSDYYILNVTNEAPKYKGQRWQDYLPKVVSKRLKENPKIWDGIIYDNLWDDVSFLGKVDLDGDGKNESTAEANKEWRQGVKKIISKTRKYMGDDFLILGNGGSFYANKTDGNLLESFPTTSYGNWDESLWNYFYIADNTLYPLVNTHNNDKQRSKVSYRKFRYGLTSTLLEKGYYSYDKGPWSHTEKWWFDEYDVSLGQPLGEAYNILNTDHPTTIQEGVWRRDFKDGLVFVNSTDTTRKVTLETGFEKIKGDQDPDVNTGKVVGSISIPAHDGIILLGRLAQIKDVTFINGGYAKVFNAKGEMERNSFFSYNSNYPGGAQIVSIPEKNKTVVAGETYVEVYKDDELKYRFAPYGEDFKGGVNVAVAQLYKKDKRYYIVTGTQWYGPQIRIFDMKGQVKHPGCFPYAESFQGGVNVGVGDLNGDGRAEIISAAGYGGGPHIRVLNNKCEVINPGFFAYDEAARFGVNIGVGDLDGDGKAEIVTGPGPGGGPHIKIFNRNPVNF